MVTTARAITTIYTCKKLDTVEITKITSQFYLMDINQKQVYEGKGRELEIFKLQIVCPFS